MCVPNEKKSKQKIGDDPTMLLKTKEIRSDILDHPTMLMKTNALPVVTHDIIEKSGRTTDLQNRSMLHAFERLGRARAQSLRR
jgi:hypothetical protein